MPNALVRRSTCSSRSGTVSAMWSIPGVITSAAGLEQLDEVAGGVDGEDLRAARAGHDLVAERTPSSVSRATSPSRSSTMRWMRFQPPGPGRSPSVIAWPAELLRTGQQEPQVAAGDVGERRLVDADGEAEVAGVEVDGRGDVVDQVAHVHGLASGMVVLSSGRVPRSASSRATRSSISSATCSNAG